MKKFFAFFIPFILFTHRAAFAKIEFLPQDEKPKQFIQLELSRTVDRGIDRKKIWGGAQYGFDWQPFSVHAGVQAGSSLVDLTARSSWLPLAIHSKGGVWRFGFSTAWHMQRSAGAYTQNDILEELEVRWISLDGLSFAARTGYSLKTAAFDAANTFATIDGDFVAYAEIDKVWKSGLELFASLGAYNYFRYPMLFCPQWTVGAAWNIKETIRFGALVELGMTDFFASVAYFNHVMVKCNMRVMF